MILQLILPGLGARVSGTMSGFLCDVEFLQALPIVSKMEEIINQRDLAKIIYFLKSTLMLIYKNQHIASGVQEAVPKVQFSFGCRGRFVLIRFNVIQLDPVLFSSAVFPVQNRVFCICFFLTFLLSCRRGGERLCMRF